MAFSTRLLAPHSVSVVVRDGLYHGYDMIYYCSSRKTVDTTTQSNVLEIPSPGRIQSSSFSSSDCWSICVIANDIVQAWWNVDHRAVLAPICLDALGRIGGTSSAASTLMLEFDGACEIARRRA